MLRLHNFVARTNVEGPGLRAAVWVQGCSIGCPGCFNPETWSPTGGELREPGELAAQIVATNGIEGVTFLGGEPFDQAEGLAEVARAVRRAGLSVMTFSGYRYERLRRSKSRAVARLLGATDLLVDGPYMRNRPDHNRPWVGSTNQDFHFLTDRYTHLRSELTAIRDGLEIHFLPDGSVVINGMADASVLEAMGGAIRGTASPAFASPEAHVST